MQEGNTISGKVMAAALPAEKQRARAAERDPNAALN
jgi:hypothetical protein